MSESKVLYRVRMEEPSSHYFKVEMTIRETPEDMLELKLPTWLPGAYLINDFSANIESFQAFTSRGENLKWIKSDKLTWQVHTEKGQSVLIKYNVYGFQLEDDASYLSDEFAILNPGTVCLVAMPHMEDSCELKLDLPDDWSKVSTGMTCVNRDERLYQADDYHELMDCPMLIGNHFTDVFEVDGIPHEVAIEGRGNLDVQAFVDDLRKITEVEIQMMKHVPYKRYVYLFLLSNKAAGLEHRNSTLIFENRFNFKPRDTYVETLSIFSHELFHAWNVKALRPVPLIKPNYFVETYTGLLWFSEGFTNYYHHQFLMRAEILSLKKYLDAVATTVLRYRRTPGHEFQSAYEGSWDAWIKYYKGNENTNNSAISYYLKGSLIAFFLDLIIIKETEGKMRLDDLMRDLYMNKFVKAETGFTYTDVIEAASRLTGKDMTGFFRSTVESRSDLPFESYFEQVGLELKSDLDPEEKKDDDTSQAKGYLGIRTHERDHRLWVWMVNRNSPARESGMQPRDEILAINGFRMLTTKALDAQLVNMVPGESCEFTLSRFGEIKTVTVTLDNPIPGKYRLIPRKDTNHEARCMFKHWTGFDFSEIQDASEKTAETECVTQN